MTNVRMMPCATGLTLVTKSHLLKGIARKKHYSSYITFSMPLCLNPFCGVSLEETMSKIPPSFEAKNKFKLAKPLSLSSRDNRKRQQGRREEQPFSRLNKCSVVLQLGKIDQLLTTTCLLSLQCFPPFYLTHICGPARGNLLNTHLVSNERNKYNP